MVNNISIGLAVPSFIDIYQVASNQKPEIDLILLLFAIIPSLVGSFVRVMYENQKIKVSINRKTYIIICSLALAYVIYETTKHFKIENLIGIFALIMGVISVDIIKFFIEDLPKSFPEILRHFLLKNKNNNNHNDPL